MNSATLAGLTLPPYWTRTAWAVASSYSSAMVPRMVRPMTAPAPAAVAALPVPMAHTGS